MVRNIHAGSTPGAATQGPVSGTGGTFERTRRVRESFLTTGTVTQDDLKATGLTSWVLESWRRSLRYGLTPSNIRPIQQTEVDLDSQLTRTVDAIVTQRDAVLEQSMCGLSLTDGNGTVVRQWARDQQLGRWLERHNILPSFSVDESILGTSSGICVLSGKPTMVRGPEHFCEKYDAVTSAGVPVVHPITHHIVGSLNLTSRYEDTSPVMLSWVMELVRDVERALQEESTRQERVLLDAYLTENRDARHPLVALNEQTIITNATAARLLASVDQALLWEHASRAIRERCREPQRLVLTDGTNISVECNEVADVSEAAGAVLKIRQVTERAARADAAAPVPGLGRLVGKGPRWRELCHGAQRTGTESVLVTGERGTGKLAVAKAMAGDGPVEVIDAADAATNGAQAWLSKLEDHLARALCSVLVIRRCDELDPQTSTAAANLLRKHRSGQVRVLGTAAHRCHGATDPLLTEFTTALDVPALRDRPEDLPALLEVLTAEAFERLGRSWRAVHWMPDAVQALSRLDWPGNVTSLEAVVLDVVSGNNNGYISASDLPVDVVARASRRKLAGLEQVEATAIIAALRDAGGNKNRAADALGIARSTLYRKMRALGIDLSTMAF